MPTKERLTMDEYGELIGFGTDAEDRADQEIGFGWDSDTIGLRDMTMTPDRAIELLRELKNETNMDRARVCAEDIIVDLLNYLGAEDVGYVWTQEVPAWPRSSE
jgi:hypothetical protein